MPNNRWLVLYLSWLQGGKVQKEGVVYEQHVSIGTDESATILLPKDLGTPLPDKHYLFARDADSNVYEFCPHSQLAALTRCHTSAHWRRFAEDDGPVTLSDGANGTVELPGDIILVWRVDPPPPDPPEAHCWK